MTERRLGQRRNLEPNSDDECTPPKLLVFAMGRALGNTASCEAEPPILVVPAGIDDSS